MTRSLRVGEHRVIFTIERADVILIVKIGHRGDVYRQEARPVFPALNQRQSVLKLFVNWTAELEEQ